MGIIIRQGKDYNLTLSSILFDKYGTPTNQVTHTCQNWSDGFAHAKQNYTHALFIDSGTIFTDWNEWKNLLDQYPHKGLIGHIIAHASDEIYLDQQCWFCDLSLFDLEDLQPAVRVFPQPQCSHKHLHDDYTPLYVTPGNTTTRQNHTRFGQGLIAKQMQANLPVVNWNNRARTLKHFVYADNKEKLIDSVFADYKMVAEQQLWILNNEPVTKLSATSSCMPGSGLFWIVNAVDLATRHMTIVDISSMQLKFCKHLWDHWDGENYGQIAWQFVKDNYVRHFQLDNPGLSNQEKIDLLLEKNFIAYVNQRFFQTLKKLNIENFSQGWQEAKTRITIDLVNDNFVTWILGSDRKFDKVWHSNILNYKWTLIHTTNQQYTDFLEKLHAT